MVRILSTVGMVNVLGGFLMAQTTSPIPAAAPNTFDYQAPAEAQVPPLHDAWAAEHDPVKRKAIADELIQAVIHEHVKQQPGIVEEIARRGAPPNEIAFTGVAQNVMLHPVTVLSGVTGNPDTYPPSPLFRRMTADRIEAWTAKEGWLFDQKGKVLVEAHPPRRDGKGRDWFGAFLPDGTWITTDLWDNDGQINCFSSTGQWKWELPGSTILARLPKPQPVPNQEPETIVPSIGWARVDKTGRRWLVALGYEYSRAFAFVKVNGQVQALPPDASLWSEVYPRAMSVRGYFIDLYVDSDDARASLNRNEAGHGMGVGWPNFDFSGKGELGWGVVIPEADDEFGFWPGSHRVFIEGYQNSPESFHLPKRVWFFGADGSYEGEIIGTHLSDAANGRDILIQDGDSRVLQIARGKMGLAVTNARHFMWADGTTAMPLAIYDDLKLGFFLRGPGLQGYSDDSRRARAAAEVVLARWTE